MELKSTGFFWKTLLVVGALTISGTSSFPHKPLTYEEAVDLAVSVYNSKSGEDSLYRLLEAVPAPMWDTNSKGTQELNFTIKETVCPAKEEASLDKCDFKEGGEILLQLLRGSAESPPKAQMPLSVLGLWGGLLQRGSRSPFRGEEESLSARC
uniref:Vipericidin n=1 Tax=Naja naja TaxID=35670 RepID=A0A8C6XTM2_NAJNA